MYQSCDFVIQKSLVLVLDMLNVNHPAGAKASHEGGAAYGFRVGDGDVLDPLHRPHVVEMVVVVNHLGSHLEHLRKLHGVHRLFHRNSHNRSLCVSKFFYKPWQSQFELDSIPVALVFVGLFDAFQHKVGGNAG